MVTEPLSAFEHAYIVCALWSSTDNSRDDGGDPLDDNYSVDDLSDDARQAMVADCRAFYEANATDLSLRDSTAGGHDFWLTRNGHGCGFWDGDWPAEAGERLTQAAEAFGSCDLYVGDDGKLYVSF